MSVLVHAEVDGDRLDDDDVLHESLLILVGGDETTRHVISGGMEQLLLHPDQRRLPASTTRRKIPVAVEEMLRWVSPIKNMCRTVTHDIEFMGQQLLEGQKCMLLYESANRDETKFDDPFRFDVERHAQRARRVRLRRALLPRPGLARLELTRDVRAAADPPARPRARGRPATPRCGRPTSSAASSRCR